MEVHGPIKILCDNQATLSIAKDPMQHDRTKYIEIDRLISMNYIPSRHQVADILTKPLHRPSFYELWNKLDLLDIYYQAKLTLDICNIA